MPKKELFLEIQGRVIDHLGIAMYQNAVNAVAELIANSWDADAPQVEILIPDLSDPTDFEITVKDTGVGMAFKECQDYFLKVGRNRRAQFGSDKSKKGRPVLGRKGIGKFAGFGIANVILVDTTSEETGEHTVFKLDIEQLRKDDSGTIRKPIEIVSAEPPNKSQIGNHGTTIKLQDIKRSRRIGLESFAIKMSRRFLLTQMYDEKFEIKINSKKIPDSFTESFEYVFPKNYDKSEQPSQLIIQDGWGIEELSPGKLIKWRMGFFKDPIEEEELRGIAVFTKGKLSQKPFLFNLSGGISGQHGIEYLTGQVIADFVDEGAIDLIATERQRINWESDDGEMIQKWGQGRIKQLTRIWKGKRAQKRQAQLEDKVSGFKDRLDRFKTHERQTVKKALMKVASIPALSDEQLKDLGEAMLLSWESGRLRDLIQDISDSEDMDECGGRESLDQF